MIRRLLGHTKVATTQRHANLATIRCGLREMIGNRTASAFKEAKDAAVLTLEVRR